MNTVRVDSEGRIVLPNGQSGDVFDVRQDEDGRYLLVPLETPSPLGRAECMEGITGTPLTPVVSWEQLRELTREP